MPFLKRLGYYLAGLSVGLIFLAFFLKKKSDETGAEFCYLPNCRVLKDLRSKPMRIELSQNLTANDSAGIRYLLLEGKVKFKESDTKAEPCKIYRVEGEYDSRFIQLKLENCNEFTVLQEYLVQ